MKITIATYISLVRIVLSLPIVIMINYQQWNIAIMLFVLAMTTDLLDGFIARRYNQESELGQLVDPIADKILIMSSIRALVCILSDRFIVMVGLFFIIKEIIFLGAGAWLRYQYHIFIKPSRLSRAASIAEMIMIVLLMFVYYMNYVISSIWLYGVLTLFVCVSLILLVRYGLYIWYILQGKKYDTK